MGEKHDASDGVHAECRTVGALPEHVCAKQHRTDLLDPVLIDLAKLREHDDVAGLIIVLKMDGGCIECECDISVVVAFHADGTELFAECSDQRLKR